MLFDKPTFPTCCATLNLTLALLLPGVSLANPFPDGKHNIVKPKTAKTTAKPAPIKKNTPTKVASKRNGEQIYKQMCASCHGPNGEGAKRYNEPLTGEQSVGELARFIKVSMPPGSAPKLPAEDAQRVAEYIHGAFYSPLAQERNRPARVELSRLTVRQYRNVITDLIGSFRKSEKVDEKRGLTGKYFKTRQGGPPILERIDPEIQFDFGTKGALEAQDDPYQFTMDWRGSVLAPDTGEYEFIVRTDQGMTLWVNDMRQPLVDAQVKSGDSNEYRASLHLLGGRLYPLRLEFFKGVRGVNDLKKLKEKPPQKAFIKLEWRLPKRSAEVIPQRFLFPTVVAPTYVATTPFPPDDRSIGYERGTSISKEWDAATTEAALEAAGYVATHLRNLAGVADDAKDRDAKLREFCRQFTTRAFRRPLTDELVQFFVERQFKDAPNSETAVKRVVLLTLKSPRFLYRELSSPEAPTLATPPKVRDTAASVSPASAPIPSSAAAPGWVPLVAPATPKASGAGASSSSATPDPYNLASRLSFAMWDSLPDEELLKAAAAGELVTREQVMGQAQRMATDPRAWAKMRDFLLQWLKVDHYPDLAKDAKQFPGFNEAVASDLRTSLELGLEHIVWSEKSDFRELMLTDKVFLNERLARVYGELLAPDIPGFQMVSMDYGRRSGVLTHPYLLASFAYIDTSSPIHRGVLLARSLLGRTLQPPPEAFTPLAAELHPKLTTRQRVALQTRPAACSSCHSLINPLGFSLEKFDAIGSLRALENEVPVDATGGYQSRSGEEVKFSGARDLAQFLASSEEVHASFVERLFQHTVKQPIKAFGPYALTQLQMIFRANQFNIRQQMIETAVMSALTPQISKSSANKNSSGKDALGKVGPSRNGTVKSSKIKTSRQYQHKGIPKT